jgi:hypothetical protein
MRPAIRVESGVTAIGWDGGVSPCLPLLHNHVSFVGKYKRYSRRSVHGAKTKVPTDSRRQDLYTLADPLRFQ